MTIIEIKREQPGHLFRRPRLDGRRSRTGNLALVALMLAAACDRTPPPPPLARVAPGEDWTAAVSRDSALALRVPPRYRRHVEVDCWAVRPRPGIEAGARSACVAVEKANGAVPTLRPSDDFSTDGYTMRGFAEEPIRIDGNPAMVERALLSGGIEGATNRRSMLIRIQFAPREWAVLRGWVGDDAGYDELLAIAHTIRRRS